MTGTTETGGYQHVIVPVDGSQASFDAIPVGGRFATVVNGTLEVVAVCRHVDANRRRRVLEREIEHLRPLPIEPVKLVLTGESASEVIADMASLRTGSLVVMSSHGHGRSAAVIGSTTDAVLRARADPIVVVGSNCDINRAGPLTGTYLVPLDGSRRAEFVLPTVASWADDLGGQPWLLKSGPREPTGLDERSYLGALAHELHDRTGCDVGYDVLEADHVARSIAELADEMCASLIFMTTHGRTGLARLRSGSVAAEVVRYATCPVVMIRPPDLVPGADIGDASSAVQPDPARSLVLAEASWPTVSSADRASRKGAGETRGASEQRKTLPHDVRLYAALASERDDDLSDHHDWR